MSRVVRAPVMVQEDEQGRPVSLVYDGERWRITFLGNHWREWFGALDNRPERDVWMAEVAGPYPDWIGVCELHCLRLPLAPENGEKWLLWRWED